MFRNPTTDLIVVLVIVLLIFGPKRLPQLGRQLGSGLREFKDSITGKDSEDGDEERPALEQAPPTPGAVGADAPGGAAGADAAAGGADARAAANPERQSAEVTSERGS